TDRLVIMNHGKVVKDGSPDRLIGELEAFGIRQPCAYRLGGEVQSWLN
ncbi:MAG: ABC transporter ATP-binding protein, partial [Deltaproteobacteria bacterium]|nr:ABC transporter ATP-binding protein [Deltaproteobacteria bacterium]